MALPDEMVGATILPLLFYMDKKKIKKESKKFLGIVKNFLKEKNGGTLPPEWGCSLMLLQTYYEMFIGLSFEIEELDSLVIDSRYGKVPTPLLGARDKAATHIETMLKEMGLTLKAASKLEIIEPVSEESPLEKYAKDKLNERL